MTGEAAVCAMIITCIEVGRFPSPMGEAFTCVEVIQLDAACLLYSCKKKKLEMLMKEKKTEDKDR